MNAVWTSEAGEQFEYWYRLFFFVFKRERGEVFLVYRKALEYNKTSSFCIRLQAIIRKLAKQMKVCDAKLQGL